LWNEWYWLDFPMISFITCFENFSFTFTKKTWKQFFKSKMTLSWNYI
jgi:hypothetical protein